MGPISKWNVKGEFEWHSLYYREGMRERMMESDQINEEKGVENVERKVESLIQIQSKKRSGMERRSEILACTILTSLHK